MDVSDKAKTYTILNGLNKSDLFTESLELANEVRELRRVLEEVMTWIDNWGVPFEEDQEWMYSTKIDVYRALENK